MLHAEMAYQLNQPYGPDEKPVTFSDEGLVKIGNTTKYVSLEIRGASDEPAYIDQFTDLEGGFVNSRFIAGNMVELHGGKHAFNGNGYLPGSGLLEKLDRDCDPVRLGSREAESPAYHQEPVCGGASAK